MTITIHADPVPLRVDEHGVIRIGDSRLALEAVLDYHHQGMAAEAIAEGYADIITLADVHAVLAYYHRHREEIDRYLQYRDQQAEAARRDIEATQPTRPGFRDELLARQARRDNGHVASGQ
ncbi:MAG TPA: DUF433 domain-containing protein [Gemmataceae bacterium]|jgi:uncharacterized protein (DUF433 family)|nr:DUF433 domain-containing protein [Gemmataceae bacterium]